jgi:2'-5' RNA ligase
VVWAGISEGTGELSEIFSSLEKELVNEGYKKDRRGFSPHITIGRVRSGRNRAQLSHEIFEMENTVFGSVQVEQIFLKKSVLTPKGPIYSNMASSSNPE